MICAGCDEAPPASSDRFFRTGRRASRLHSHAKRGNEEKLDCERNRQAEKKPGGKFPRALQSRMENQTVNSVKSLHDGNGYCPLGGDGDIDTTNDCTEDDGEIIGMILVASLGGMATVAMFTPGIIKLAKYNKRVRRLEPIVNRQEVSFFYRISPRYFATGFRF